MAIVLVLLYLQKIYLKKIVVVRGQSGLESKLESACSMYSILIFHFEWSKFGVLRMVRDLQAQQEKVCGGSVMSKITRISVVSHCSLLKVDVEPVW